MYCTIAPEQISVNEVPLNIKNFSEQIFVLVLNINMLHFDQFSRKQDFIF